MIEQGYVVHSHRGTAEPLVTTLCGLWSHRARSLRMDALETRAERGVPDARFCLRCVLAMSHGVTR